jgi:hypothetical protein
VLLRLIEEPPAYQKWSFGVIYGTDGTTKPLSLKELTNKIIHAEELSWDLSDEKAPKTVVYCPGYSERKIQVDKGRGEYCYFSGTLRYDNEFSGSALTCLAPYAGDATFQTAALGAEPSSGSPGRMVGSSTQLGH